MALKFQYHVIFALILFLASSASLPLPASYLLQFLDSLPKPTQLVLPWNQSNSPKSFCQWARVSCDSKKSFQVRALNLSSFGLLGILNNYVPYLCLHKHMHSLDLSGNSFSGKIPQMLGNCGQLDTILLNDNGFEGPTPHPFFMSKWLRKIDLGYNSLSGEIPPELILSGNKLNGTISERIAQCNQLVTIALSGHIPQEIGGMSNLVRLALYNNSLTGGIPSEVVHLKKLRFLSLAQNDLIGEVQFELKKNLPALLALGNNHFSGSFPIDIGKCSSLRRVVLSNNLLQGPIPADLKENSGIFLMKVQGNLLEGKIPPVFGHWTNLSMLDLSRNRLFGSIPPELGKLENLQILKILDLSSNSFASEIPPDMNNMMSLYYMNVSFNHLTRNLSSSWMRIIASYPGSFVGNPELCSLGDESGNCRELRKVNSRGRVLAGVIIVVVVSVALLCAMMYVLVVRCLQKKNSFDQTLPHERQSRTEDLLENLKIEDIIRATE
ncbi:hypothetical protein REPUB_Repub08aG0146200 [Reevesia pubescens]